MIGWPYGKCCGYFYMRIRRGDTTWVSLHFHIRLNFSFFFSFYCQGCTHRNLASNKIEKASFILHYNTNINKNMAENMLTFLFGNYSTIFFLALSFLNNQWYRNLVLALIEFIFSSTTIWQTMFSYINSIWRHHRESNLTFGKVKTWDK